MVRADAAELPVGGLSKRLFSGLFSVVCVVLPSFPTAILARCLIRTGSGWFFFAAGAIGVRCQTRAPMTSVAIFSTLLLDFRMSRARLSASVERDPRLA